MGKVKEVLGGTVKKFWHWVPEEGNKFHALEKNLRTIILAGVLGSAVWGYLSVSSKIEDATSIEMCEGDISKTFDDFSAINAKGLKAERGDLPLGLRLEARKFQRQVLDMIESGQCRIEGEYVIVEIEGLPSYRVNLEDLAEYMCDGLCINDQDYILRRLELVGLGIVGVAGAVGAGFLAKRGFENYIENREEEKARPRHQVIGEHESPVIIIEPQVKSPPNDEEILDLIQKGELRVEDIQDVLQEAVAKGRQAEAGKLVELLVKYHRARKPTT